jgi:hypothetical protein
VLVVCDADADPYLRVRDWWNRNGRNFSTPREHLFQQLGLATSVVTNKFVSVGKGGLIWLRERPAKCSASADGAAQIVEVTRQAAKAAGLSWRETNYLLLRRGPYVVAAGMDESLDDKPRELEGRFVNLFDPELGVQTKVTLSPGSRFFLLDLDLAHARDAHLLASACKALPKEKTSNRMSYLVEGVGETPAIVLLECPKAPLRVTLAGQSVADFSYSAEETLLRIHFENDVVARELKVEFQ